MRPEDAGIAASDGLAASLVKTRHALSLPLARAARRFLLEKAWLHFGCAWLGDHARERFGRSGRWVRDLAALGDALARLPRLVRAMDGDDGGRPLGRVAAGLVGRCATEASVEEWIALARSVTVRELRERVAQALAAPEGSADAARDGAAAPDAGGDAGGDPQDGVDARQVVLQMTRRVRAAYEETHALHEALEGHATDTASFVEALVAEACSGPDAPELVPFDAAAHRDAWGLAAVESRLADATDRWRTLQTEPLRVSGPEAVLARRVMHRARFLARHAGEGNVEEIDEQLRALIALENELERALGRLLSYMGERRAWSVLHFSGAGHYGEQRLGMSRSAAGARAWLARVASRTPALRKSYEEGGLGHEAALLLARLFTGRRCSREEEVAWIAHAEGVTLRRLRDEVAAWSRGLEGFEETTAIPSDAQWRGALEQAPGMSRKRVSALCEASLSVERARRQSSSEGTDGTGPDVFHRMSGDLVPLRLRLPRDLASLFLQAIESRRGDLPAWAGLASLLVELVETWDRSPHRASDRVFIRDGWRCTAPGCTSRRNLEDHHIRYRSRGGDDSLRNRTCLCRFHHQMGEHGGLMRCTGSAPLGMTWLMGRGGSGGRFKNDRAI